MRLKQGFSALLFAGIALCSVQAQVKAGEQAPPAAASTQDFSKEAYVIERLSSRIVAENDGTATREVAAQIKMLADAGVKAFAVLNFTYTSANEVVDIDYVRVRKPDGTVVKTPDYNIQDMPGEVTRIAPLYSDIHEKHVAVKGLGAGDTLEYLIRFRVVKAQVPGQFWYEYVFTKSAITKDERLEISLPSGKYVKVVSPDFKPEITEEGGRRIYRWSHANLILKEKEPGEIPRRIPANPDVQLTTFASWEDIGRWYGDLQKEPLQLTPAIQAKAAELTAGLKTDDEKIHAIYNFVSLKFHYIGLDFGIGRYQPHAADDVLDNGYGDCKDKHTLLAALLKAAGIDAWPALIHSARKLDQDVPSPAQFNHVITVVPRGEQMVWLDTTPEVAPYGMLLQPIRNKQALVIPSSKPPVLMTTPQNPPTPQEQLFTSEGKLDDTGTFSGHVEQSYRGDVEVVLRGGFRQLSQSQWKDGVQRFSYGLGFGGEVSNVTVTPPDKMDEPFRISYDYVRKSYSGWDDRQITPPMPPMGVEATKDTKKPQDPVVLGATGEIAYHTKVSLPAGYSVEAPKSLDLVAPYAEYHTTHRVEGGVLISSRRLTIKQNEVALKDWESYRDFGKAISDDEWKFISLNGGPAKSGGSTGHNADLDQKFRDATQAMQKGDRSRAQELFEEILRSDTKYPLTHLNLGFILMMQNKTTEAIAEWHKEQEINPNDSRVYQVPATYLTYMNHQDEAIEEWRKLLKVDPKNHDAALALSGLLFAESKNSDATTVLEDAVKATPDSSRLNAALGEAYVKDNQPDKGIPYLEKSMQDSKEVDPGVLNDAAYLLAENNTHLDVAREYAEKAVAELDRRSVEAAKASDTSGLMLASAYAATWDTVGWVYFEKGDLTRAEDYLRAAWSLGQGSVAGDHLGQVYEKLGKKKEAERVYVLALSAQYVPDVTGPGQSANRTKEYQENRNKVLAHYEKLTGRKQPPAVEIKRLPNGEWTKTPSDELAAEREVQITKTTTLEGVMDFDIVFTGEKIETVRLVRGDDELRGMSDKLQTAHFPILFPADSQAKIVRRVKVTCHPRSGCSAQMLLPGEATMGSRLPVVKMDAD